MLSKCVVMCVIVVKVCVVDVVDCVKFFVMMFVV